MKRFVIIAASWFGTGYSPIASGTVGTLAAIPFYLPLSRLPLPLYLLTTVTFILFAIWVSDRAEMIYGGHDSSRIVIDEVAGFLVTMTALPLSLFSVIAGFFLFRFFDIVKPSPVRNIDRHMGGGRGVVLDDVAAGIYACIVLHVLVRFW
ncbi:MAG TPA: phosphatidylglycerophosphatase A [Geobacterales bacterium]|nr:phosphatidylglycerophosphatase A [Geobacterales bacterium]